MVERKRPSENQTNLHTKNNESKRNETKEKERHASGYKQKNKAEAAAADNGDVEQFVLHFVSFTFVYFLFLFISTFSEVE